MQTFFISLIMEIFKWFAGSARPKMIEGAGPGSLEKRLQDRLKKEGWE